MTMLSTCCGKDIAEDEYILNHGLCDYCMDIGVAEANQRLAESEEI